jgi:hypothetical protein
VLPICDHPERLGARIFIALRVDCDCCTFWRGVVLGFCLCAVIAIAVAIFRNLYG